MGHKKSAILQPIFDLFNLTLSSSTIMFNLIMPIQMTIKHNHSRALWDAYLHPLLFVSGVYRNVISSFRNAFVIGVMRVLQGKIQQQKTVEMFLMYIF